LVLSSSHSIGTPLFQGGHFFGDGFAVPAAVGLLLPGPFQYHGLRMMASAQMGGRNFSQPNGIIVFGFILLENRELLRVWFWDFWSTLPFMISIAHYFFTRKRS